MCLRDVFNRLIARQALRLSIALGRNFDYYI
jgi:hypothetical protein